MHAPEFYKTAHLDIGAVYDAQTPTDETPVCGEVQAPVAEAFMPAAFLTEALEREGSAEPAAWAKGLDERANDAALKVQERIFFVNRALRLYMSEQEGRNHMDARMLLADGLEEGEWKAIVNKGIVPWLLNKLPVNKAQLAQAAAAVSEHAEQQQLQTNEPEAEAAPQAPEGVVHFPSMKTVLG